MLLSFWTSLILPCSVTALPPRSKPDAPLYDENIEARIWRTALKGAPAEGAIGWPMYTYGAHNNTPALADDPDHEPGTYIDTSASGWTAGFFPDSLWQLYRRKRSLQPRHGRHRGNGPDLHTWLAMAQAWTDPLITNRNLTNTHDIGFLAFPFESALEYNNETKWRPVLAQMAGNLASRFVTGAGVIRSWDNRNSSVSQNASHADSVLVIIDNMMNLPLLARAASHYSGNQTLLDIAISHADKSLAHHIRPDGSTYHVCDYSATTGEVYLCRTAQGLADNSTWARGQAWAIHGFAEMYQITGERKYLDATELVANWFLDHLPEDGVPFWDFSVPEPEAGVTPRDTSAATIAASGLLLLQDAIDERQANCERDYRESAVQLLRDTINLGLAGSISYSDIDEQNPEADLGAATDVSTPGNTNISRGFEAILMHATANNNPRAGDERSYDHGLVYGDYYLIKAGNRLLEWYKKRGHE